MSESKTSRAERYPVLFSLTGLTGAEANTDRTVAWAGFEFNRRWWYILLAGFFPSGLMMLAFWPLLGSLAFIVFVLCEGGLLFALVYRSNSGLGLRPYEVIYDKHRSVDGKFILCGRPIPVENISPGWIYCSSQLTHNRAEDHDDESAESASDIFSAMAGLPADSEPSAKLQATGEIRAQRSDPETHPQMRALSVEELLQP